MELEPRFFNDRGHTEDQPRTDEGGGCPRCHSRVLREGDEDVCLACGFRRDRLSGVVTFILAGGRATHLGALTRSRAKAALPLGRSRRIIDSALDNLACSELPFAVVLGQYQWPSVQNALRENEAVRSKRVRVHSRVAPVQRGGALTYRGSADAVFRNFDVVSPNADEVLIVPGDQPHTIDYRTLIAAHRHLGAEVTIAVAPPTSTEDQPRRVAYLDPEDRVTHFARPGGAEVGGFHPTGIFVVDSAVLRRLLEADAHDPRSAHDLEGNVSPLALATGADVAAFVFEGDWRRIDSPRAYWRLATETAPTGECDALVNRSLIMPDACIEAGAAVRNSVVLAGARIEAGATVDHAIIGEHATIERGAHVGSCPTGADDCTVTVIEAGRRISPNASVKPLGGVATGSKRAPSSERPALVG